MDPSASKSAPPPFETQIVTSTSSPEFSLLRHALFHSAVVALDAEWKPQRSRRRRPQTTGDGDGAATSPSFPAVTLLQIACRIRPMASDQAVVVGGSSPVFLVDLISVPLAELWVLLRELFESPEVLKLGFRFKQDLVYLSSTFASQGCGSGFERVEPFLDITNIYHHLKNQSLGQKLSRETKSLATICEELLNISLSKELQCSDWSCRPLSEEQILYAAADAYYLLQVFTVFQQKVITEGKCLSNCGELNPSILSVEPDEMNEEPNLVDNGLCITSSEVNDMVNSSISDNNILSHCTIDSYSCGGTLAFDDRITSIVREYGEKILLEESDKKPRSSRRKGKQQSLVDPNCKVQLHFNSDWQGPPPWDPSVGGDGYPKFLCDVMVEGLAKHLRCVGIDAAIPFVKKPEPRQLLNQAYKEKRILLTRDVKLLKHQYLIRNQVYKVRSLLKNDQLLEVIETFQLKISEEQLMSRCTKCNGSFIQKPLTIEEAIEASKGFQIIPSCLFNRNLEFWKCTDCNQLYWEGTQYHNAVQKFVSVCKLND
ncbi:uncharacterized protein [Typha latifolia]|uniref:uncharacterized protein n=1 Tax=Typha latifolia TaxID=4733 RepID=UPI003C2EC370